MLTFVTREQLKPDPEFPTPFHLYDEAGIREAACALHQAFAWNEGFKNTLPSKATLTIDPKNFAKKRAVVSTPWLRWNW